MTLFKKAVLTPVAIIALSAAVQAVAAPINHTIMVQALVPTENFYVLPSDPNWIGDTQALTYSPTTKELTSITRHFDALHTAGAISGKLLAPAILGAGANNIPLTVKFNGKTLSTTEQEVLTAAEAGTPKVVNLEIIPTKVGDKYEPGNYMGNVQLSFDAVI